MKLAFIAIVVAGSAFAQRPNPNPAGFGSVLYPGTGGPPPARVLNGGFGSVLYPGTGGPPGRNVTPRNLIPPQRLPHGVHGPAVIVPVPVYYGGYYDPGAYAQQPAPYEDPGAYPAPSQAPVVILNQSMGGGPAPAPDSAPYSIGDQAAAPARPDTPATIYLIALTDQTILPTIAYWVEGGDTLTYITTDGDQNRISLALVDRDFSKKLNDDRGVEFKLPKQ